MSEDASDDTGSGGGSDSDGGARSDARSDRRGRALVDDTMPASPPSMDAAPPRSRVPVERYRMGVELGRGGMGRVVEAFDVQLGRTVALKEALPHRGGQGSFRRFAREVQITARLEHASIVPLYDSGTTADGRPFYVMRRVSGRPLDEMISRARNLGERLTLLPALLAAFDAIAHAHRRGVIHRDLKPANILVGDLGETVVIDWGLAKVIGEEDPTMESIEPRPSDSLKTQVGSVFGTPGFMAPEQARGEELGPRSDVYALGACLYQLLAGVPPFGGSTSATEVIDRTRKNQIRPLKDTAPGAPRELVAIVDKSLALEPGARYANAAQLGEDVRRFLAGQLVAAHHYTRRQRVARFARRNRLTLTIVAVAAAVIAVLTWTNVQRILHEREMERDAKVVAQRNADDLVIQSAINSETTNPTRALAILRRLQPDSPRLPEARAIAEGAVMHGVAWGIDTDDDDVLPSEISPDGTRLAIATLTGILSIYDLDTRQQIRTKMVARGARGMWIEGGKRLFVWGGNAPPFVLDPTTNQTTPVPASGIREAVADPSGQHVIYDVDGAVQRVDLSTLKSSTLWEGSGHSTLSDDGQYYAIADGKQVIAYDIASNQPVGTLATTEQQLSSLAAAPNGKLAFSDGLTVYELDVATHVWAEHPTGITLDHHVFVMSVRYRGTRLAMYTSEGRLAEWLDTHWIDRMHTPGIQAPIIVAGPDLIATASDGKVYWAADHGTGTIALPQVQSTRIAGRRGVSKLVVSGRGLVLVYDLTNIVPDRVPGQVPGQLFAVLDDDTILSMSNTDAWSLIRTGTGQHVDIPFQWVGVPLLPVRTLGSEKRALVVFNEVRSHLLEVRDEARPLRNLANGPTLPGRPDMSLIQAALVPGDATVFSDSESRIYVTFADGHPTEIAQLDGAVRAIASIGRLKFAAVSENGEVVRGTLDGTGTIERAHVPARDELSISADRDGRVMIGADRELYAWDKDVESIAKFDHGIYSLAAAAGGLIVNLDDRSDVLFDPDTKQSRVLINRGVARQELDESGTLLATLLDSGKVIITELPAGEPFELPASYPMGAIGLTPTSRTVVVGTTTLDAWHLPAVTGDLPAWIDAHTNARESGRGIDWPAAPPR
nr:serine/threonine-protein kinase [Kofleriaceae bacterium]